MLHVMTCCDGLVLDQAVTMAIPAVPVVPERPRSTTFWRVQRGRAWYRGDSTADQAS
jgi:hypothetical protein